MKGRGHETLLVVYARCGHRGILFSWCYPTGLRACKAKSSCRLREEKYYLKGVERREVWRFFSRRQVFLCMNGGLYLCTKKRE